MTTERTERNKRGREEEEEEEEVVGDAVPIADTVLTELVMMGMMSLYRSSNVRSY